MGRGNGQQHPFRTFQLRNLEATPGFARLSDHQRMAIRVVGSVLPFKTNNYVCEQLIDWDNIPDDPMFQLTFPQEAMLDPEHFSRIADLITADAPQSEIKAVAREIQLSLNPHPAGQVEMNAGYLEGQVVQGVQHKYRETVLFFPTQGQTCHAYCTYCFRWPQFVKLDDLKFASKEIDRLVAYLKLNPAVSDVLFTGGDPMTMRTELIRRYVEPLLADDLGISTIRFGTKAPAYWPYRFTDGTDADDLLRLFEEIVASGRHLAVLAHFSHPVELSTDASRDALRRIIDTGAMVRCQAPLIRHVNGQRPDMGRHGHHRSGLGSGAVLLVCGARHRCQAVLRGAAGGGLPDLHRCLPAGVRSGPHMARAVDVGHPGQSGGGRHCRDRR